MGYMEKYSQWCNTDFFDEETKNELKKMEGNDTEIKDSFYQDLEFGTAGLRGIVGVGSNSMNKYTVGKATQGLANYILRLGDTPLQRSKEMWSRNIPCEQRGIVIGYDSRNSSPEFSNLSALILCANGIKTFVFSEPRPLPELSYAIRQIGSIAGVMITASHNPPKYNGYKVFWEDGSQIVSPIDTELTEEIGKVNFADIKTMPKEEAVEAGLYQVIGSEMDDKYIDVLKKLSLNPDAIKAEKDLKIVYTPLHGGGGAIAKRALKEYGFENVYIVPEQEKPDGDFPTVKLPNPEDPAAFDMALELAKKVGGDIVVGNDPDVDRIGLFVKDAETGEYILFNGNMLALIIAEYVITGMKEKGILPENAAMVKSIVSSRMADKICEVNNVKIFEVLTGFKNIAEKEREIEAKNEYQFIMGYEESYGCVVGTHARDKDGIIAMLMLSEAAAYYRSKGLTLWDEMQKMYEKYGYYAEANFSITHEGADGAGKIKEMMSDLRKNPQLKLGEFDVLAIRDYSNGEVYDVRADSRYIKDLPKSNVLYYELKNDFWVAIRPSGTEPKIKFYIGVTGTSLEDGKNKLTDLEKAVRELVK